MLRKYKCYSSHKFCSDIPIVDYISAAHNSNKNFLGFCMPIFFHTQQLYISLYALTCFRTGFHLLFVTRAIWSCKNMLLWLDQAQKSDFYTTYTPESDLIRFHLCFCCSDFRTLFPLEQIRRKKFWLLVWTQPNDLL